MEQRWLTLDMLCSSLRLPAPYVKWLTKEKYLVAMGTGDNRRWLDPTAEYAEKLRLAAVLHGRQQFIPPDINEIALLSLREVAVICNWSLKYARWYMKTNKDIPRFKANSQLHLYSIRTVREILWRRQGRVHSQQRSPFMIQELIDLVLEEHQRELDETPTDKQYAADDKMMRKLERIVDRSDRDQAMAKNDFASKVELARKVVQILESGLLGQASVSALQQKQGLADCTAGDDCGAVSRE